MAVVTHKESVREVRSKLRTILRYWICEASMNRTALLRILIPGREIIGELKSSSCCYESSLLALSLGFFASVFELLIFFIGLSLIVGRFRVRGTKAFRRWTRTRIAEWKLDDTEVLDVCVAVKQTIMGFFRENHV